MGDDRMVSEVRGHEPIHSHKFTGIYVAWPGAFGRTRGELWGEWIFWIGPIGLGFR